MHNKNYDQNHSFLGLFRIKKKKKCARETWAETCHSRKTHTRCSSNHITSTSTSSIYWHETNEWPFCFEMGNDVRRTVYVFNVCRYSALRQFINFGHESPSASQSPNRLMWCSNAIALFDIYPAWEGPPAKLHIANLYSMETRPNWSRNVQRTTPCGRKKPIN